MVRPSFTSRLFALGAASALALAVGACKPDFAERASEVTNYRVLALQSEPAEWTKIIDPDTGVARPARFRALVATPIGVIEDAPLQWSFCTLPKPLTELNDVSIACFDPEASYVQPIGQGPAVSAVVPDNTCRQFGPDVPEDQSYRPADPDVTGGYYQPVRILYYPNAETVVPALEKMRIKCGLPGATQEQTVEYGRRYHVNKNPAIEAVSGIFPDGQRELRAREDGGEAFTVARGTALPMRVWWPGCPETDACGDGVCGPGESRESGDPAVCAEDCAQELGCGGSERYLAFDLETRALRVRREAMRVSWFVVTGGGAFDNDRSGADESDPARGADNVYNAPGTPGDYPIWVVLRDSRGGVTWKTFVAHVE